MQHEPIAYHIKPLQVIVARPTINAQMRMFTIREGVLEKKQAEDVDQTRQARREMLSPSIGQSIVRQSENATEVD
jgi:hypothetical protein